MTSKFASIRSNAWRTLVVLLTAEIAVVSVLRYFTTMSPPPDAVTANAFADPFLPIHVASAVTALVVAPVQFLRVVRTRWRALHRFVGRLYLVACAVGAPSGFMLALGTTAGPTASLGFAIPAVLWLGFTWLGWRAAVERRFDEHRDWMLRSYAITANAITLRVMLPAAMLMGLGFYPAYRVISWASWIANVLAVEYVIRRRREAPLDVSALAPA